MESVFTAESLLAVHLDGSTSHDDDTNETLQQANDDLTTVRRSGDGGGWLHVATLIPVLPLFFAWCMTQVIDGLKHPTLTKLKPRLKRMRKRLRTHLINSDVPADAGPTRSPATKRRRNASAAASGAGAGAGAGADAGAGGLRGGSEEVSGQERRPKRARRGREGAHA